MYSFFDEFYGRDLGTDEIAHQVDLVDTQVGMEPKEALVDTEVYSNTGGDTTMNNLKIFNRQTNEVLEMPFQCWDEIDTILTIIGFLNADYEIYEDGELVEKWFNGEPIVY